MEKKEIIGELEVIKDAFVEKEIHWKIPSFLSLSTSCYYEAPPLHFRNALWYLKLDPCEWDRKDDIALHLKAERKESSCDVVRTFGIKKVDDSTIMIATYSFKHSGSTVSNEVIIHQFSTRSALSQRESELLPSNNLTILCNLKHLEDSIKITELDTLSENIKSLFINQEFCDTSIKLEDKELKAHKIILAARSPVFAAMFKHETSEKTSGMINIHDCDAKSFQEFLEFLYCGKLQKVSFRSAFHLYKTADKYGVQELKNFCVKYMKTHLEVENVCDVISLSDLYEETDLLAAAKFFFNRNLKEIFLTVEWKAFLKNDFNLATKLLIQMASKVQVVE